MPALRPMPADAIAFGNALRKRRRQLGLTQDGLADRLTTIAGRPFPRQTISNYERGLSGGRKRAANNVEWQTLLRLCEALDSRLVVDVSHPTGVLVEFAPHNE